MDYTEYDPALDSGAFSATSALFWTSSQREQNGAVAYWWVRFRAGDTGTSLADSERENAVRCVRTERCAAAEPRFVVDRGAVQSEQVVSDRGTGLQWQRLATGNTLYNHAAAINYCSELPLDFALPSPTGSYAKTQFKGPFGLWCKRHADRMYAGAFRGTERDELLCVSTNGTISEQFSIYSSYTTRCDESNSIDLGPPNNSVTVADNACMMVRGGCPSWWGTRAMRLENPQMPNSLITSFVWNNTSAESAGSGKFVGVIKNRCCATPVAIARRSSSCRTLASEASRSGTRRKTRRATRRRRLT